MKISLKKFNFPDWSVPLALVLVCLVSYGLLLRDLGFYWDDWPSVWFQYTGGGAIFKEVFASDRPLLGRLFMLTMPVFRSSIIGWQLFGIFTRALASISLWGLLVCVFPKRRNEAAWTALLFAVYPGFMQQWIAVTYSHAFIAYAVFFVSMLFMVLAFRKPRWFWLFMGLSYLTSLWTMFAVDVYTGLEVIRPLLLWVVLSEKPEFNQKPLVERIKRTLLYFLPYVGMMVLFVIWRVFLLAFPRGTLQLPNAGNAVSTNPFIAILQMVSSILQDLVVVTFGAWGRIFPFANPAALPAEYWWVVILVFVLLALYLSKLSSTPSADDQPAFKFASLNLSWGWLLVGTGCLTLLAGGWAYWIINLPFRLVFPYDRTSLPMFLGVSLLITGLMEILLRSRLQKIILLSLLVALAAGSHLLNAAEYVKDYQDQKDFFWQLSWRIPGIQPGTT
ncbi:MAG: hypothetical protein WCI88_16820, partial [Chloroflexota bacterium]